ncbi:MAG: YicC/YloC family endoribonuclease [Kiritimatiellales bacterium]
MPVKSMTGFGTGSARGGKYRVSAELSSVNRKQLDVTLRLPPQISGTESKIQKLIQDQISRGRITGVIAVEMNSGSGAAVDSKHAEEMLGTLRGLSKKLNLPDDLSAKDLLQIPGCLKFPATAEDHDEIFALTEKAVTSALKKLNTMRVQEGKILEKDFLARLTVLESIRKKIAARAPVIAAMYRKKLFAGLENAGLENLSKDDRVIKEIALFAERSDISEETVRLESHIQQFKKMLRTNEPAGRPLDFLAQEMFREINTVGSKANDLQITEQVVKFKTELERVREQVQNVE